MCERELKSARSGRAESELWGGGSSRGDEYENEADARGGGSEPLAALLLSHDSLRVVKIVR
jgi:hypothetical protein